MSTSTVVVPATLDLRRFCTLSAAIGAAIWLGTIGWLRPSPFETPWAMAILLLAPSVLVPLVLRLFLGLDLTGPAADVVRWAVFLQAPTALSLASAFTLPQGPAAAGLALPWLATTIVIALAGLSRAWQRGFGSPEELCIDAGLIYLPVGGSWVVLSRYGARPLDFEPVIVLLTRIHFHYAGFVLPVLTGLAARAVGGRLARAAAWGVMAGVPLVAIGITTTQLGLGSLPECAAVILTATSGLLSAALHLRLAVAKPGSTRVLWGVAVASMGVSMALALTYGCRAFFPLAWLDIPWMRAIHGTANALGFGLAGVLAWNVGGANAGFSRPAT